MVASLFVKAVVAASLGVAVHGAAVERRNLGCTFTVQASAGDTCDSLASDWTITKDQFILYNPSVGAGCANGLKPGTDYCVEWDRGSGDDPTPTGGPTTKPTTTPPTTKPTTTTPTTTTPTTTKPTTTPPPTNFPSPVQDNINPQCTKFYKVVDGDSCEGIQKKYQAFSLNDFYKWNPAVGTTCGALWPDYYVCVGIPGTPTGPTTTVTPIPTNFPTPIQDGITTSCKAFYKVVSGDNCDKIQKKYGFVINDFYKWNPAVGTTCGALWPDYYVCVSVTNANPPTQTVPTVPTNFPTPVQDGITTSCKNFYKVVGGDNCDKIQKKYGTFTLADFYKWNPALGTNCANLWPDYYVCVGIPGTPSTPSIPTPHQDGIREGCKTYYKAVANDGCQAIADKYKITLANFYAWNTPVGNKCAALWPDYYYCVAI